MRTFVLLTIFFFTALGFAQNTGSIAGKLIDKEYNDEPLAFGNVLIKGTTTGTTSDIDGVYSFEVDCCQIYTVRGSKENNLNTLECYITDEKYVGKTPCDKSSIVDVPLPLKLDPCCGQNLGACLCLQPIYFDFDRYSIRPDAEIELNKILMAMIQNPGLIVNIESHTDRRGSDAYNEILSDKRAQSTLEWLVKNGIDSSRLTAKGFGENQLLDRCTELDECGQELKIDGCSLSQFGEGKTKCSDGVTCSEKEHQNNRRSKFLIDERSQF